MRTIPSLGDRFSRSDLLDDSLYVVDHFEDLPWSRRSNDSLTIELRFSPRPPTAPLLRDRHPQLRPTYLPVLSPRFNEQAKASLGGRIISIGKILMLESVIAFSIQSS